MNTDKPYSFEMADDSMPGRYSLGDTIYVDPTIKPAVGDNVVLWNDQRRAIVGELLGMTPDMWRIGQWRESQGTISRTMLELPVSEWPLCHRITGRRNA